MTTFKNEKFQSYMHLAIEQAKSAGAAGEVPVGAVIISQGEIIAQGQNRTRRDNDPTAHAEIIAIRQAAQKHGNFRLDKCDLYVTLEPCAMCAGAIAEARIARIYYGAEDPKSGGTDHGAKVFSHPQCHHKPEIYQALCEEECTKLLASFFQNKR